MFRLKLVFHLRFDFAFHYLNYIMFRLKRFGSPNTLKIFLNIVLKELGYNILYKEDDYIIPMLFDGDVCSIDEVIEFKKRVGLKRR